MRVEGVNYEIDWKRFRKGRSIFIPCLDPPSAKQVVLDVTRRLKIKTTVKIVILDGIRGLRIWRV